MTCPLRLISFLLLFPLRPLCADVHLPALLSDHMVLERSSHTRIWGIASPGEAINVSMNHQSATTKTDADGRWIVRLDLAKSEAGPFEMTVAGKNQLVVHDVLVGEPWLASGQSNMEWLLKDTINAEKEIANSTNPKFRYFGVVKASVPSPADDCQGKWVIAGPETSGDFSAVSYYFGKALQRELKAPVGVICASWGGSPCEAWMSAEAFDRDPKLRQGAERRWQQTKEYPEKKKTYAAALTAWLKETHRTDRPRADVSPFVGDNILPDGWSPVKLPGLVPLPKYGAVWLRKEVTLPAWSPKEKFLLEIGEIQGFESIYWNGKLLKETTPATYPGKGYWRRAEVPFALLRPGKNIVAMRVFAPIASVQFLAPAENLMAGSIAIRGEWLAKAEYELPALDAKVLASAPVAPPNPPRLQDIAAQLFNGMIHPLVPYGIRGVIWYQGEANHTRAEQYVTTFPRLIEDWRAKWHDPNLPFYHCQLANFTEKLATPGDSTRAELREAQLLSLKLPATGEAVLIDLGDSGDIHPRYKEEVGERLARIALAHDYGQKIACSGPVLDSSKVEGGTIRLTFSHADGGLVAKPLPARYSVKSVTGETAPLIRTRPQSELEGFAICGDDHKWVWADAKIDRRDVIVSSPEVARPVAVRYAWADNPTCNLFNGAGLPASPFRTDNSPRTTAGKSY